MKNALSLLLLLGISLFTSAQDYAGLVNEEATWKQTAYGWVTSYWTYKFEGDTVINGQTYKKLYAENEMLPGQWIYNGALRDDLENQRVYRTYGDEEHLLYDFSLEPGQSTTIYPAGYPYEATASSTGTVVVNGEERKVIYFDLEWYTEVWVEGVGSMQGVDTPFITQVMADWIPTVTCYYWGNDLAYDNPDEETECDAFLAIPEFTSDDLRLIPNPAATSFRVNMPVGIHLANLRITDQSGRVVLQQAVIGSTEVDVAYLATGFYIVTLTGDQGLVFTGRLHKN